MKKAMFLKILKRLTALIIVQFLLMPSGIFAGNTIIISQRQDRCLSPQLAINSNLVPASFKLLVIENSKDSMIDKTALFAKMKKQYKFKTITLSNVLLGGGSSRLFESPLLIVADGKKYVLRHLKEAKRLEYIISYQMHLKEKGLPCPAVIKTLKGEKYFLYLDKYYYLEEYLEEGKEVKEEDLREMHYRGMGQIAARIHNAAKDFTPQGSNPQKLREEIGETIIEFKERKQEIDNKKKDGRRLLQSEVLFLENYDLIINQLELFKKRYTAFLLQSQHRIAIHGDIAYTNLRFDKAGNVVGIFDFTRAHKNERAVELNQVVFGRKGIGSIDFNEYNFLAGLRGYLQEVDEGLGADELLEMLESFRSRFLEDLRNSLVNKEHRYFVSPQQPTYKRRLHEVRQTINNFQKFIRYSNYVQGIILREKSNKEFEVDEGVWIEKNLLNQYWLPLLVVSFQELDKEKKSFVLSSFSELIYSRPCSNLLEQCIARMFDNSLLSFSEQTGMRGVKVGVLPVVAVLRELMLEPLSTNEEIRENIQRKYGVGLKKRDLIKINKFIRSNELFQNLFLYKSRRPRVVGMMKKITNDPRHIDAIMHHRFAPLSGEIHPGISCPVKCRFCYNARQAKDGTMLAPIEYEGRKHALGWEEIKNVVDDYVEAGVQEIYVSGGKEPFNSKYTLDTIKYIRRQSDSVIISMLTIGLGLSRPEVRKTVVENMNLIRISLDSASPEVYDYIKGVEREDGKNSGVFEKVLEGVRRTVALRNRLLKKGGTRLKIGMSFLCHEENYQDLEKFLNLAKELGLDFVDVKGLVLLEYDNSKVEDFMNYVTSMYNRALSGEFEGLNVYFNDIFFRDQGIVFDSNVMLRNKQKDLPPCCFLALSGLRTTVVIPNGRVFVCINSGQPGYDRDNKPEWEKYRLGIYTKEQTIKELLQKRKTYVEGIKPFDHCTHGTGTDEALNRILWKIQRDIREGYSLEVQPIVPHPNDFYFDGRALYHKSLIAEGLRKQSDGVLFNATDLKQLIQQGKEKSVETLTYVQSRIPREVVEGLTSSTARLEILSGTTDDTNRVLGILEDNGAKVTTISTDNIQFPTGEKFYKVEEQNGTSYFLLSSVKGKTRLSRYLSMFYYIGVATDRIRIRDFGTEWMSVYKKEIKQYSIERIVICNDPSKIAKYFKQQADVDIEDVHGENLHYIIVKQKDKNMILFDLLDLYGSQIKELVSYISLPQEQGGLGIRDIVFTGESGGIGKHLGIGDVILPKSVQTDKGVIKFNNVLFELEEKIAKIQKEIKIHPGKIKTVPTILTEDGALLDSLEAQKVIGVELELEHILEVISYIGDISLGVFLIVTDLPGEDGKKLGEINESVQRIKSFSLYKAILSLLAANKINVTKLSGGEPLTIEFWKMFWRKTLVEQSV